LADLDAAEYHAERPGTWTRGLLIRRNIADGDLAFFSTWCPAGTPIDTLVKVEGHRWAIEDSFETAKNELGLDHNETRSWHDAGLRHARRHPHRTMMIRCHCRVRHRF
jgi:SRSO17 transposase